MKEVEEINQALRILERGAWSQYDRDIYEKEVDLERQRISEHETAIEKGIEEGVEKVARNLLNVC